MVWIKAFIHYDYSPVFTGTNEEGTYLSGLQFHKHLVLRNHRTLSKTFNFYIFYIYINKCGACGFTKFEAFFKVSLFEIQEKGVVFN